MDKPTSLSYDIVLWRCRYKPQFRKTSLTQCNSNRKRC